MKLERTVNGPVLRLGWGRLDSLMVYHHIHRGFRWLWKPEIRRYGNVTVFRCILFSLRVGHY